VNGTCLALPRYRHRNYSDVILSAAKDLSYSRGVLRICEVPRFTRDDIAMRRARLGARGQSHMLNYIYTERGSTHWFLSCIARSYDRGVDGRLERKELWA
jgi:hypothetical protein